MMQETIIGVFWGQVLKGRSLVFTTRRLFGGAGPSINWSAYYTGAYSPIGQRDRQKAYELAFRINSEKQFEIPIGDVQAISVKEPGSFSGQGALAFRTTRGEVQYRLSFPPGLLSALMGCLYEFAPDRIYASDGQPLSIAISKKDKRGYPTEFAVAPRSATPDGQPESSTPAADAPPSAPTQAPACPRCGKPVSWIPQHQRWFCPAENVYPWG